MHDFEAWTSAEAVARTQLQRVGPEFSFLADRIMNLKAEILGLALSAGSGDICRACQGECCRFGRYHVTLLDLMLIELAGLKPPLPRFGEEGDCPYGNGSGCFFEPRLRPMTCVVFNCELIESRMKDGSRGRGALLEQQLRGAIAAADILAGMRLSRPALLATERGVPSVRPHFPTTTQKAGGTHDCQ